MRAATGAEKKNHACAPFPERERLDGHWESYVRACVGEGAYIVRPCTLVEVDGEEPTGLISKKRIHAHHVTTGQVRDDGRIIDEHERLVRTRAALDFRKFANALDELVATGGRVSRLACSLAHEPRGEDILSTAEQ